MVKLLKDKEKKTRIHPGQNLGRNQRRPTCTATQADVEDANAG